MLSPSLRDKFQYKQICEVVTSVLSHEALNPDVLWNCVYALTEKQFNADLINLVMKKALLLNEEKPNQFSYFMTLVNHCSHNIHDAWFSEINLQDLLRLRDKMMKKKYLAKIRPLMKTMFVHYKLLKCPIEKI